MIALSAKKYFLFDMDGTLVDLEQLNYSRFREAVLQCTQRELSYPEYMKYMAGVGSHRGFMSYFAGIGLEVKDLEAVVNVFRERKEYFLHNHFDEVVTIKEGAIEFLTKAKALGVKLAVGTSTVRKFTDLILKNAGLVEFFDCVVTVDDVVQTKPSPEIFLEALSRIHGTIPEAVIFEDSANGVKSAENSGIDFYILHNKGKNDEVAAKYTNVITSYKELLPQLLVP